MTQESFARAKTIFLDALERPDAERKAFVSGSCGGDTELEREVATLLESESHSPGFLHGLLPESIRDASAPGEASAIPGTRVGPWTIVREIGHGGMGIVYLAERADHEYRGRVALKVVRRGMDTDFILQRFRSERQILASLSHPNIARLLDGGTTAEGRPYFAMEYIEGEDLIAWCRARRPALSERAALFQTVCAAVQYAHRNLVVHRDIKPSNILVTPEGVPKLLDFGLAKVLDARESGDTSYLTIAGISAFTPEYASPEQVRLQTITTASDIFSLGVVLYELLTDVHPFRRKDRSPADIARAVCETQPEPPSRAVIEAEVATGSKRARLLGGDLDTIILMALRKEPERRYATAEKLSEDLQRHFDGRPVLARKDTLPYRAGKFVRRHRLGVAAASLVAASLVAGSGVALWQAGRARASEAVARRRFEDVRSLAKTVLFQLHDEIAPLPGSTKARATLVSTALRYLDALAAEAGREPALARDVAAGYARLGRVQGGSNATLGDTDGAVRSHRSAIRLLETLADAPLAADEDRAALASELDELARILGPERDETLPMHVRALAIRRAILERDPSSRDARRGLAISYSALANFHSDRKDWAAAVELRQKERGLFEDVAHDPAATDNDRRNLSLSNKMLGALFEMTGRQTEALALYREAIALDEARTAANPASPEAKMDLSFSLGSLGAFLLEEGDLPASLDLYERALRLREAVAAADPANAWARNGVARAHERLATIEDRLGHRKAAEAHRLEARPPAT